jgi:hypothetical protein
MTKRSNPVTRRFLNLAKRIRAGVFDFDEAQQNELAREFERLAEVSRDYVRVRRRRTHEQPEETPLTRDLGDLIERMYSMQAENELKDEAGQVSKPRPH